MAARSHMTAVTRARPWQAIAAMAVIALLFVAQVAIRWTSEINHDTGWYLYVAAGLLDGKTLYTDFVEVNPPLSMWLTVPPVAIARLTGLASDHALYIQQFLLTAISLLLAARYLRAIPDLQSSSRLVMLCLMAFIMLFAPGPDFGQREHLMVLLFLPWLLLRMARASGFRPGMPEAALIGIAAAVAVSIKPHSAVAVLMVEVVLLLRFRSVRLVLAVENLAALAFCIAYLAVIWLWATEFLSVVLPLGVEAYVPYYGRPASLLLERSSRTVFIIVITGALLWLSSRGQRLLPAVLLAAAAGFLASYFLQAKGYFYHLLPAVAFASFAAAAACANILTAKSETPASPLARMLPVFMMAVVLFLTWKPQIYFYAGQPFEQAIDRHKPGAKSVFIASTNVFQPFPMVVKRDLVWASRFPVQWLVPYVSHHWGGTGALPDDSIIQTALQSAVSDLDAYRPDIVFIDRRNGQDYVKNGSFDFLAFYGQDPRFAGIWAGYVKRGETAGFDVYVAEGG